MTGSPRFDRLGRRGFLGLSGSTALALLAAPAVADEGVAAVDGRGITANGEGVSPWYRNVRIEAIGRYESGLFDEGGAEIVELYEEI